MAVNETYRIGQYIPIPVPDGTGQPGADGRRAAGIPMRVGQLNGVVVGPEGIESGHYDGEAPFDTSGAHQLPVNVVGGPVAPGDYVYITPTNLLTTAASGNKVFGWYIDTRPQPVANGVVVTVKIQNA